jgi:hypothetical protein
MRRTRRGATARCSTSCVGCVTTAAVGWQGRRSIAGASSRPVRKIVLLGVAVLVGLLAAGTGGSAEAAFTFHEQGADVVATGSGSIDLAGLVRAGRDGTAAARR